MSSTLAPSVLRLRGRTHITAASRGRRGAAGPVTVRYALGSTPAPAVGYAVGRHAGGAVERNRVRRRLRAAVRMAGPSLQPGLYLVSADARALTSPFEELRHAVDVACAAAAGAAR